MKRRTFLQLFALPPLAFFRPRAMQAQQQAGLAYSDSDGNTDFTALHDGNRTTGITYGA